MLYSCSCIILKKILSSGINLSQINYSLILEDFFALPQMCELLSPLLAKNTNLNSLSSVFFTLNAENAFRSLWK